MLSGVNECLQPAVAAARLGRALVPQLLGLVMLGLALLAAPAWAAGDDDAAARAARIAYERGRQAMAEQAWHAAEADFEEALRHKAHYQIAGNLGACELELKKYREAATHLQLALDLMAEEKDPPADAAAQRDTVVELLGKAKAHVATLLLEEATPAVDLRVTLDGRPVERWSRPLFVDPGPHVLEAQAGDESLRQDLEAEAGETYKVPLKLAAAQTPAVGAPPESLAAQPVAPIPEDSADPGMPIAPLFVAGGAALAALAVGVGLRIDGANSERLGDEARAAERANPLGPCATQAAADCNAVLSPYEDADARYNASTGMFVVGGILSAATAAYGIVLLTSEDAAEEGDAAAADADGEAPAVVPEPSASRQRRSRAHIRLQLPVTDLQSLVFGISGTF